jgi:hypothetical protein
MTADVANLLAEIRRSGGDVKLIGCDRLKLVAPIALLPELAERVRAAKPVLLVALADTSRKANAAQQGGGGVLNPWRNGATAQHPTAEAADQDTPTAAAGWRSRHREALAYWRGIHSAEEAERLAWGEIEDRWHQLHGTRAPQWQCAGCGEPIGGLTALDLTDGNRVHLDKLDCLLTFGDRWRSEATAGLQALGLDPPPALELP